MGLMLSLLISYVGLYEALECIKHILSGVIPDTEPEFHDIIQYYARLLQKTSNPNTASDWINECGQGYLCLSEDKKGHLRSAAIKFYGHPSNSTAILFSTKISSFGQDSVEENSQANGDYRAERYPLSKTKTIISNTSESFSVGNRNRSPTLSENISDPSRSSPNSFERDEHPAYNENEVKQKLTWQYSPRSPSPTTLPEIHFQSYDEDKGDKGYSEEYLRSLDGIKLRPLQRSDPSGRRRSFRKRSSSSNSSKESRASREEELKIFTSLEEAEFNRMNSSENYGGFGSTPNLAARSYSRSRSREKSNEAVDERVAADPPKNLPKVPSYEEKIETEPIPEVKEEEEEVDFWANSDD